MVRWPVLVAGSRPGGGGGSGAGRDVPGVGVRGRRRETPRGSGVELQRRGLRPQRRAVRSRRSRRRPPSARAGFFEAAVVAAHRAAGDRDRPPAASRATATASSTSPTSRRAASTRAAGSPRPTPRTGRCATGFGREACSSRPASTCASSAPRTRTRAADLDLDATQVTYQVACVRGGGCAAAATPRFPLAAITIYNAVATVRDDSRADARPPAARCSPAAGAGPTTESSSTPPTPRGSARVHRLRGRRDRARWRVGVRLPRPLPCAKVAGGRLRLSGLAEGAPVPHRDRQGRRRATRPARRTVNVDGTAAVRGVQPRSGRTLVVKVADELSGVAGGQITVGGTPLPTTLAPGALTARCRAADPARAEVTVTVSDNAGNTAAGVPPRIASPAACGRATAAPVTLRGRLTDAAGRRLAGVPMQATATISRRGATAQPAGAATTDAGGRFALRLPAGPSRTVRLIVAAARRDAAAPCAASRCACRPPRRSARRGAS